MPPPSPQALPALLSKIRTILPTTLPKSAAYILSASTLTALGHPNLLGPLFLHVTGHHHANTTSTSSAPHQSQAGPTAPPASVSRPASPDETRAISLHLRDLLLKEWTLIGIPLVITAVASLGQAERAAGLFPAGTSTFASPSQAPSPTATSNENTPDQSTAYPLGAAPTLSPRYASGDLDLTPASPLHARGAAHVRTLYRQHLPAIMATWGSHEADFRWLEESVIYGVFLSNHTVLSDLETSLVTASGIMVQGLKGPSLWHLRGLRRLGASRADVEAVVRVVAECVKWAGGRVKGATGEDGEAEAWVSWVGEVESEV
ncbi:hypothetical protein B0J12DRAFT_742413 [Macrophomina phaseolina]|uniref:Carboxymuconolactone decarboxylase-like domain-containing protein n=1 Tax=Macrophomina phaseolina TaxID=35725 RepID=A0ABQ8G4N4_9PEZI|nr:hypothetical protein B0J12DRAFT_742413 [Macrophomina phaseolina]